MSTYRFEPGVYASIAPSAARVRALARASTHATTVEVHAPTTHGAYLGRLARDAPRRLLERLGLPAAEPGRRGTTTLFFDDEALLREAARAGLVVIARRGAWLILQRGDAPREAPDPFALEVIRALRVIREAESRRHDPPARAVREMRARGRTRPARGPIGRARLRRAIGWVDAALRPPNCLRRTLAEIALDAGAAGETLVFGLDVGTTGHVAFAGAEERTFDVAFEVPPE